MDRKQLHSRLVTACLILASLPAVLSAHEKKQQRVDRYGDPLPPGAIARLGTVRLRHGGEVVSAAFSPDGKTLATGSADRTARWWDVVTGKELRRFVGHRAAVSAVAFSPDGKLLATAGSCNSKDEDEHSIRIWDLGTGRLLGVLDRKDEDDIQSGYYLVFSPDGKRLVGGSDRTIIWWDVGTGKESVRRTIGKGEIKRVDFSHDGTLRSLGRQGDEAVLWNARSGEPIQRFVGHREVGGFAAVRSLALSPDGKMLATGGVDETIRLWDVATGKQLRQMEGHQHHVDGVMFSPDGKVLASGSWSEASVRLWDANTGKQLRVLRQSKGELALAFSPDGKMLATGANDQTVRLWDTASGRQRKIGGHEGDVLAMAFRPGGEQMASVGSDGTYRFWRKTSGEELHRSRVGSALIRRASLSANGEKLALFDAEEKQFLSLWDSSTDVKRQRLANIPEQIWSPALSPDGRILLACDWDGRLYLWNLTEDPTTKPVVHRVISAEHVKQTGGITKIVFSPDGKCAAVVNEEEIRLVDLAAFQGAPRRTREDVLECPIFYTSCRSSLALSAGGSLLAVGSWWSPILASFSRQDGQPAISLWCTDRPHAERREFGVNKRDESVTALAFSPDGKTLAAARNDGTIQSGSSPPVKLAIR